MVLSLCMENLYMAAILLCAVVNIVLSSSLSVSKDMAVKPTPFGNMDPNKRVNISLTCTGSEKSLSFYISHVVTWSFIDHMDRETVLTESFYSSVSSGVKDLFDNGHYVFDFTGTGPYSYDLDIIGVTDADDGIYKCSQKNPTGVIISSVNVSLTVLRPVEKVVLELYDSNAQILGISMAPVIVGNTEVVIAPGGYNLRCTASGSNPAPWILFTDSFIGDVIGDQVTSVQSTKDYNSKSMRVKYTSVESRKISILSDKDIRIINCVSNLRYNLYPNYTSGMKVKTEKPRFSCVTTFSTSVDAYNITCNVSSNANLFCQYLQWTKWNTPVEPGVDTSGDDSLNVICNGEGHNLEITLFSNHYGEGIGYYIRYGNGPFATSYRYKVDIPWSGDKIEDASGGSCVISHILTIVLCLSIFSASFNSLLYGV